MSTEDELRLELERAQEKLHEWKAKAKVGVDKLREQCVQLQSELDAQRAENAKLRGELALVPPAAVASAPNAQQSIVSSQCYSVLDAASAQLDVVLSHSAAAQSDALDLLQQRWQQCHSELLASQEKYKKKAEQSIRLATKQQETLQHESRELHSALERALTELKERENAVEQRNLAVAALEKQLDAALYTVDSLRADIAERHLHQQNMMNHGGESSHSSQGFVSIEEVEREMEKIHEEFGSREALIHQQHRDELERLVRSHEQEMSLLEEELREVARQDLAVATAAPSRDQKGSARPGAPPHLNDDDEAYTSLMMENDTLRKELKDRDAAIAALQQSLKNNGTMDEDSTGDRLGTEELSPSALRKRVADLEHQVQQLSEQLWVANNQMLETKVMQKEQSSMNTAQRKQNSDAQQASYLRSIIVRLICEKSEVVKANFIPVLTTLLQFEPEELRSIYVANPTWAR